MLRSLQVCWRGCSKQFALILFCFQPSCRFGGVLEIIVLLEEPLFPPSFSCQKDYLTFNFGLIWCWASQPDVSTFVLSVRRTSIHKSCGLFRAVSPSFKERDSFGTLHLCGLYLIALSLTYFSLGWTYQDTNSWERSSCSVIEMEKKKIFNHNYLGQHWSCDCLKWLSAASWIKLHSLNRTYVLRFPQQKQSFKPN